MHHDDNTHEPKWLTVNTGLFGTSESFVPLQGAEVRDGDVVVGYEKAQVKDAPNVLADQHLSAMPVIARDGRLLGAVTIDAAVGQLAPAEWGKQAPRVFS